MWTAIGIGAAALIGGVASGMSGSAANRAQKDVARRERMLRMQAEGEVTPESILETTEQLTGFFRRQIAAGLGPTFEQRLAQRLNASGFNKTGVGIQIGAIGDAIPSIAANTMAFDRAFDIQRARVAALTGVPFTGATPQRSVLGEGLAGATRAGFTTAQLMRQRQQQTNSTINTDFDPAGVDDPFTTKVQ